MRRWQIRLGAWLGAIAIVVGCYLPHHLAIDIVHAAGHLRAAHEQSGLTHNSQQHDRGKHHHHDDGCAVCASLSTALAGTTLPVPQTLAPPERDAVTHLSLAAAAPPSRPYFHTPYAPRAPPSSA